MNTRMTHKLPAQAFFIAVLILAALGASSCTRMSGSALKLQANPILTGGIGWAVVKDAYVRLKEGPSDSTRDLDHLRRGGVLRLDARKFGTSDDPTAPDVPEIWYGVESEGAKGWVRESELDLYESRAQAETAAAGYR